MRFKQEGRLVSHHLKPSADFVDPAGFDDLNSAPSVLVDGIADKAGGDYAYDITIPNVECTNCTLQVIQVMTDKPPLLFEAHLGMLRPANAAAETALCDIRGKVKVTMTGGAANQRRRGLYWLVAALVVPLLNEANGLTLDDADLHDITRDKLKLYDDIALPSGEIHRKRRSTSNRAMNEAERADFTNKAFALWSTWTGVDVATLKREAE